MEDPIFEQLKRVPLIWAHKHYNNDERAGFDHDFINNCLVCKEIWDDMVAVGERCGKHPNNYSEGPNFCEGCDIETTDALRKKGTELMDAAEKTINTIALLRKQMAELEETFRCRKAS